MAHSGGHASKFVDLNRDALKMFVNPECQGGRGGRWLRHRPLSGARPDGVLKTPGGIVVR